MKDGITEAGINFVSGSTTRDIVAVFLAGLGVTFSGAEYVGGLLLAIAGALMASKLQPEQDKRELWVVVITAFMASHVAVLIVQGEALPDGTYGPHLINPQLAMTAAGFFSRYMARFALRIGGMVESRADTIFDRTLERILPRQPKDGGDK
jgi:hypothetical protein